MRRYRVGRNLIPLIEGLEDSEDYKKLCELKQYLHSVTECSFVNGECASVRNGKGWQCCARCAMEGGYLKFFSKKEKHYLKLFDRQRGFLSDEGCTLPVELRSLICVCYCCNAQGDEMERKYNLSIDSIMSKHDKRRDEAYRLQNRILSKAGI